MSRFPEPWMQELLARTDIADLVGEYLALRPNGGRLWGLCPFHGEKTASFSVSREKQLYYCFGCHAGGGAVQFVMAIEKMTFPEAVQHLAQRANLALPDRVDDAALQRDNERQKRILAANREAAIFYHAQLRGEEGAKVWPYLDKRGVTAATATVFGLGFAPERWDALVIALGEKGFTEEELLLAGLARRKEKRIYDNFRNRLIFPIIASGRQRQVIGFGGRAIDGGEPKYLNTAETPVFNKRRHLYGLNLLPTATPDSIALVEGYMDVVSLRQNGVATAVATLGTALTEQQARKIKRYTNRVFLAYDGDEAGQNAAMRGLDILRREGLDARVVAFPPGQDPDDFVRANGKAAFDALCTDARSYGDFKLRRMALSHDLTTDDGRTAYAREGSLFIARLSPVEQERYYPLLSRATGFSVVALRGEAALQSEKNQENTANQGLGKNRQLNNRNTKDIQLSPISGDRLETERILIRMAAENEALREQVRSGAAYFRHEAHRLFLAKMEAAPNADPALLMSELDDADAAAISAALAGSEIGDAPSVCAYSLRKLERYDLVDRRSALQREADDAATTLDRRMACISEIRVIADRLDTLDET